MMEELLKLQVVYRKGLNISQTDSKEGILFYNLTLIPLYNYRFFNKSTLARLDFKIFTLDINME